VGIEFRQVEWDATLEHHLRQLVRLAVAEDLGRWHDWTTVSLVPADQSAAAHVVSRDAGVVAGLRVAGVLLDEVQAQVEWLPACEDGQAVTPQTRLGTLAGNARDILVCERILLNLLQRLCGIATQTATFVRAVADTKARIYDTRKTTPGMRRLEKFAVRCGGGHNHRTGLFDAILIKDNHLAFFRRHLAATAPCTGRAIEEVRAFIAEHHPERQVGELVIEIEVDTIEQLNAVLPAQPDVVLLDNMSLETLRQAVALRDQMAPSVQLEASGRVRIDTVREIALTGVDRISAGALTHSVPAFDVGLDWEA
jgi:nicotinate-nucleotide pyrophosphorylase (carboxylating)